MCLVSLVVVMVRHCCGCCCCRYNCCRCCSCYLSTSYRCRHQFSSTTVTSFRWQNGNAYVGDWVGGSAHGLGEFTYGTGSRRSGERYVGDFLEGAKHGMGEYFYPDGRVFRGQYRVRKDEIAVASEKDTINIAYCCFSPERSPARARHALPLARRSREAGRRLVRGQAPGRRPKNYRLEQRQQR